MVHLADLSSPTKSWEISHTWSMRINDEFKLQNIEEEKNKNIPVTPFMKNLDNMKILSKNEGQFIQFVALPLWKIMNKFLDGDLDEAVDNLITNQQKWERKVEQA